MQFTNLDYVLWLVGFCFHVTLVLILAYRKLLSQIPTFAAYMIFCVVRTIALYYSRSNATLYSNLYWSLALADIVLECGIFAEVVLKAFRPLGYIAPDVRKPLAVGVLVAILVAALVTSAAPSTETAFIGNVMFKGDLFASVLLTSCFVGLLVVSCGSGLTWRLTTSRIVEGLGIYCIISFAVTAAQNFYGIREGGRYYQALSHVQICTYVVVQMFWIVTLIAKQPSPTEMPEELRMRLLALNDTSKRLAEVLARAERA